MSRIGNRIITVPENVTVEVKDNIVFVKGPKGELNAPVAKNINVEVKENSTSDKNDESKDEKAPKTKNTIQKLKSFFLT